jgi:adenylate cyclase
MGDKMSTEIERKFLINKEIEAPPLTNGVPIKQLGFGERGAWSRVRIYGDKGFLTIKGPLDNITRMEYEYEIPLIDAEDIFKQFSKILPSIEKTRFKTQISGHTWEIDVFEGKNKGLVISEIELSSEEEEFVLPEWAGKEVSKDLRYFNSFLAKNPYCDWLEINK